MAEEELDGFDNLDDLFSEEGGGDAAAGGGELDELLGDTPGGEAGGGAGGETSDSELDSFFEDLSTIDDLEVAQDEAPPAEEPAAIAAPAAAAAAAVAAAPAETAPKPAAKPAKDKPKKSFMRRAVMLLIPLAVIGGAFYWFFIPSEEVPWEVTEPEPFEEEPVVEEEPPPPPPPQEAPAVVVQPPPEPAPPAPPPAEPSVTYGIQVATCFFPSCVQEFQRRLGENRIDSRVRERSQTREALEILSNTSFRSREAAQKMADRVNRENRMEGQAYVLTTGNGFKISMGSFTDLGRANIVKDALNQRLLGDVLFTTRIKAIPYTLKYVVGGRYPSRNAAETARQRLVTADSRFADAFVVRN